MRRDKYSSGTKWERIAGYSRAVRIGNQIVVSGTTAWLGDGTVDGQGDPTAQTKRCIENIRAALKELGANLEDVVRTRIYVVDIKDWQSVSTVHGEYFGTIRPATTLVEVSRLVSPEMLVEIEADAVVGGE